MKSVPLPNSAEAVPEALTAAVLGRAAAVSDRALCLKGQLALQVL